MDDPYAAKPWLKHYDDHVPHSLNYSNKTYAELCREATAHIPSRTAVYYMGRGITYHELDKLSNRFAHFLKKSGLKKLSRHKIMFKRANGLKALLLEVRVLSKV